MENHVLFDEEVVDEKWIDMGSFNHSYIQAQLAALFIADVENQYVGLVELSLDSSAAPPELKTKYPKEVKPDVSVYKRRPLHPNQDTLRMTEMPIIAIEVVSPMQAYQTILDKIELYFALGVQSCWIVHPAVPVISVYDSPLTYRTFTQGNVVDTVANMSIPFNQIFVDFALNGS